MKIATIVIKLTFTLHSLTIFSQYSKSFNPPDFGLSDALTIQTWTENNQA